MIYILDFLLAQPQWFSSPNNKVTNNLPRIHGFSTKWHQTIMAFSLVLLTLHFSHIKLLIVLPCIFVFFPWNTFSLYLFFVKCYLLLKGHFSRTSSKVQHKTTSHLPFLNSHITLSLILLSFYLSGCPFLVFFYPSLESWGSSLFFPMPSSHSITFLKKLILLSWL